MMDMVFIASLGVVAGALICLVWMNNARSKLEVSIYTLKYVRNKLIHKEEVDVHLVDSIDKSLKSIGDVL